MASSSSSSFASGSTQRANSGSSVAHAPSSQHQHGHVLVTDTVKETRSGYGHKIINGYEMLKVLGQGQHGEVWYARNARSGVAVAIKALKRKNKQNDRLSMLRKKPLPRSTQTPLTENLSATEYKIRKEIAIMKKLRHPHVVQLLEVMDDRMKEKIYMVMEFLGGGEIKWRTEAGEPVLRVSQTRRIIRDVILGLEYLHRQGIIHRDIKPANLLWTEDRRTVKIADFGISHFSYAQLLAENVSKEGQGEKEIESILMNESDLSKFAGTPMFLAPEVIHDVSPEGSHCSTSSNLQSLNSVASNQSTSTRRPKITKAIDIWALGITLYGFLFGKLPFTAENEFAIYKEIKKTDWGCPETMGVNQIPTGGRHQPPPEQGQETEGYLVVDLLDKFLQKDPSKRITLEGVKSHLWLLRDIPDPRLWLRATNTGENDSLAPTEEETSSALSLVRFRWSLRLVKSVREVASKMRFVRPQKSFRRSPHPATSDDDGKDNAVGTQSLPHELHRQRSIAVGSLQRDKGKQRADRPSPSKNKSTTDVHSGHTKSFDWGPSASTSGAPDVDGSGKKPRRGSAPGHRAYTDLNGLQVPVRPPWGTSPQPTPVSESPITQDSATDERPRSRLSTWMQYLIPRTPSRAPSNDASTSTLPSGATSPVSPSQVSPQALLARRSDDAFRSAMARQSEDDGGTFTLAQRAASWGEVGFHRRPSQDRLSQSDHEDNEDSNPPLDVIFAGYGGVARSPVSSIPSRVLTTVSSMGSLVGQPISAAHAILQRADGGGDLTSAADPGAQPGPSGHRRSQSIPHPSSPLSRPASDEDLARAPSPSPSLGDSSLSSGAQTPSELDYAEARPSTSQMYEEEDEDSEDEEAQPLEVRTRRPSWSVTDPRQSQEGYARPVGI